MCTSAQLPMFFPPLNKLSCTVTLPVDPWALDAEQHSQVDGGPARGQLTTVTAQLVAWQALHPLEEAFSTSPNTPISPLPPLSGLAGRVDAAGGGRGCPVQTLQRQVDRSEILKLHVTIMWLLLYVYLCARLYLNIIIVSDVFVSRGNACLDRLDPSLPQLLRLSLQHAAPTGLYRPVMLFD